MRKLLTILAISGVVVAVYNEYKKSKKPSIKIIN